MEYAIDNNDKQALVYLHFGGVTSAHLMPVKIIFPGVGEIKCPECQGTGHWPYNPDPADWGPCVDCKGSGRQFVSC